MLLNNKLVHQFLRENNYRLDLQDYELQLLSHPDYPSFRSISDTLDYFNILNIAAQVPKESLEQLPLSFLTVVTAGGLPELASIKRKRKIKITTSAATSEMSADEFGKIWSGAIIAVEPNYNTLSYSINGRQALIVLLAAGFLCGLIPHIINFSFPAFFFNLLALSGLFLSFLMINEDIGFSNKIVAKVCNSTNFKGGCKEVIGSKKSSFLGIISLLDAATAFFLSEYLLVNTAGFNATFFLMVTCLSLPIIIYSLYTQGVILKQWCPLCLTVSGIIGVQSVVVFGSLDYSFHYFVLDIGYLLKGVALLLLSYGLIIFIRPQLKSLYSLKNTEIEFRTFRRNWKLFDTLLKEQALLHLLPGDYEGAIRFGTHNPVLDIIAVTNPLCGFCAASFEMYNVLLKKYGDKIRISFIFNIRFEDTTDPATKVAVGVINAYHSDKTKSFEILADWFRYRNITRWDEENLSEQVFSAQVKTILTQHRNWCEINNFTYTPLTIVDQRIYPKAYKIEDLGLFMEELISEKELEMKKDTCIG